MSWKRLNDLNLKYIEQREKLLKAEAELSSLRGELVAIARTAFKEGYEWGGRQAWEDMAWDDSAAWRDSDTRKKMEPKQ